MTFNEQVAGDTKAIGISPSPRRGACPTLVHPMQTGDGLLARLRPAAGILTIHQCRLLALASQRCGNGILEITARGSLQIRGLRPETVGLLVAEIDAAGISVPSGPVIELPPLHDIDPEEIESAATMESLLRQQLLPLLHASALAPKLSIVIDSGGRFGLSAVPADIRLIAASQSAWLVAINGDGRNARPVFAGGVADAIQAVGDLLRLLLSLGLHKRCRDISTEMLVSSFPQMTSLATRQSLESEARLVGVQSLSDGAAVIGLRPRFGQMRATDLVEFLRAADDLGAEEIRPAPGRSLFLTGLTLQAAAAVARMADRYGFSADVGDASASIATCAGAGACASGRFNTKALAETIAATIPQLLDGSMTLHLSGCAKGCAHPRGGLTIAGVADGYDLILDGVASDAPDAHIAGGDIDSAIQKLARLVKNEKNAGESAAACLRRLDKGDITRVLRQG